MLTNLKTLFFRQYYRFVCSKPWKGHETKGVSWEALEISLDSGATIPARTYVKNDISGDKPLMIFFHGGGMCLGDIDTTHFNICMELASRCDCTVVAVDYKIAPEHTYPSGPNDAVAATNWIISHLEDFKSNGKVVLAGDSAGAYLAIICCLEAENKDKIAGALLAYPMPLEYYDSGFSSLKERATGYALTTNIVRFLIDTYLGPNFDTKAPEAARAFPLRYEKETLGVMPPTLLFTAEYDPLRDEDKAFGKKLQESGVKVESHHVEAEHGFYGTMGPNEHFLTAMEDTVKWFETL